MTEYRHTLVRDGKGGQMVFPPFINQDHMDEVDSFEVFDDDVFSVAYPKTGTTWLQQILTLLKNGGRQGDQVTAEAVPWLEAVSLRFGGLDRAIAGMERPRYFSSHLPIQLMPGVDESQAKYLYTTRNPKDTAVSFYYHDVSKGDYQGSWEEHLELFMKGQVTFGSYFDHVLDWWRASRDHERILFLTYEEMKADLPAVIGRIADFLEIPTSPEVIRTIAEKSEFQTMKKNPRANLEWVPQREGVPGHMRKGAVGDWRNHFSDEQNRAFDALYEKRMAGSGLRLAFGEGNRS